MLQSNALVGRVAELGSLIWPVHIFPVSSAFTVLWNGDRVKIATRHGMLGKPVEFLFGGPHTSQPSFARAGVEPADIIYPIFVKDGQIHILARIVTKETVSVEEFISRRPDLFRPDGQETWPMATLDAAVQAFPWLRAFCWTCSDHVVLAERSSPLTREMLLPVGLLGRLTYRSRRAERPLKGVEDGRVTTIAGLQGVYRLSEPSARDFDTLFEP